MANKQPFYHEIQVLFTTTDGNLPPHFGDTLQAFVDAILQGHESFVEDSVEVLEGEPEAGDPADLM